VGQDLLDDRPLEDGRDDPQFLMRLCRRLRDSEIRTADVCSGSKAGYRRLVLTALKPSLESKVAMKRGRYRQQLVGS
jgi:hypothetical protein